MSILSRCLQRVVLYKNTNNIFVGKNTQKKINISNDFIKAKLAQINKDLIYLEIPYKDKYEVGIALEMSCLKSSGVDVALSLNFDSIFVLSILLEAQAYLDEVCFFISLEQQKISFDSTFK